MDSEVFGGIRHCEWRNYFLIVIYSFCRIYINYLNLAKQPKFKRSFFKKGVAIFGTLPYNNTCRQALRKTPQQRASTISNGPSPNGKATDSDSVISRFESLWASSLESTMQMVLFCYTGNYVIPVFLRRTMICINLKAVSDSAKWTVSFI